MLFIHMRMRVYVKICSCTLKFVLNAVCARARKHAHMCMYASVCALHFTCVYVCEVDIAACVNLDMCVYIHAYAYVSATAGPVTI
jgi:hypothetical protein